MIRMGMVSVTFRKKSPKEIVDIARDAGLEGIEWGGDVHVPAGDLEVAKNVRDMTREAGLQTPSYGSYFRLVEHDVAEFRPVVESAQELGAANIRVWAGTQGSDVADDDYVEAVVRDSREIGRMAGDHNITVSYEYHGNTVADTKETTLDLLRRVDSDNVQTYWQVMPEQSLEDNVDTMQGLLPYLTNIHVFHWTPDKKRRPLDEGRADWEAYMKVIKQSPRDHWAFLEFVQDNDVERFSQDAATLIELVKR